MKASLLKAFLAVERLGTIDISRTKVSRESDKDIDTFAIMLGIFVAVYLAKGFFSQQEKEELGTLFRKNVESQYLRGQRYVDDKTGEPKPLRREDIDKIEELATKAERDFIADLEKRSIKTKPGPEEEEKTEEALEHVAERTASDTGIRALNQGTVSHARYVMFASRRDQRVCPICEGFDGNVYKVDQATSIIKNGPIIPVHPNCRCRYVVFEDGGDEQDEGIAP